MTPEEIKKFEEYALKLDDAELLLQMLDADYSDNWRLFCFKELMRRLTK